MGGLPGLPGGGPPRPPQGGGPAPGRPALPAMRSGMPRQAPLNSGNVNAARSTLNYDNVSAYGNGGYGGGTYVPGY